MTIIVTSRVSAEHKLLRHKKNTAIAYIRWRKKLQSVKSLHKCIMSISALKSWCVVLLIVCLYAT